MGFAQKIRKKFKFGRIEANTELSNSNVTAILEDSYGFLWVGTDDGLNRFDGYDFKIYRSVEDDSTSLLKNKIQSIFEDSHGTLWISTLNSGLHTYDRTQDLFHRVPDYSIQHCQVMRIIEDSDHNIWIGGVLNSKSFVARLDHSTGGWKNFPLFETTDAIYSILQDTQDEFWLGTRLNGLYKWNYKTNKTQHFAHNPANKNSVPGNYIEKILRGSDGTIWIATRSGLSNFNPATNEYKNYTAERKGSLNNLPVNEIMDICIDGPYLWIATENGGLSRLDVRNGVFSNFTSDPNDPNSLINNSIWSLHKDSHGRIWIGSYAKGICLLDDMEEKFSEVDIPLNSDLVNAILKDSRGRLWIGTEGGIVMNDKNRIHYFKHDPNDNFSLSSNAVNCLFEDSKHRIWIGHWNGGLTLFNESTMTFRRFLPDPSRSNSLSNPNIFEIVESSSTGELLICTFNGVYILKDIQNGVFENVVEIKHEGDQLLRTGFEDSKGNIWLGSYSGLSRFDLKSKTFKRFFVTNDTAEVSDRINCIFEDSKGRLWIGSFAGLHQMVSDSKFVTYTTQHGLPVNIIQSILEDNKGNLWLGTTHGLSVFDPEKKKFKTYDESDGLLTQEFRRKAFFKSDDGQLFVGGKGINAFYPDSLSINSDKPFVYITDLKIFNQSVKPYGKDEILKQSITQTREISLNHKQTFFSIHYVGINFTASYKNRYAYMLEGFDPEWNYVGDQRFATFTNLDPGTYTFRVKSSNNDGIWNEEGTSLVIHILPPWWKTIWFRALVIGLSVVIIVSIYYLRVSSIEQQKIRLENLVNQRTHELKEMNQALARQEKEIKLQNDELIHGQEETATQRDMLVAQNKKLEEASRIIERKNEEILSHNENLEREVEKRTEELLQHNHQLEQFAYISAHNL
ncbi:MAG TPA: two-component regulator propeller domain-containing protein, partial [Chryseolinea sp.]